MEIGRFEWTEMLWIKFDSGEFLILCNDWSKTIWMWAIKMAAWNRVVASTKAQHFIVVGRISITKRVFKAIEIPFNCNRFVVWCVYYYILFNCTKFHRIICFVIFFSLLFVVDKRLFFSTFSHKKNTSFVRRFSFQRYNV